MERLIDANALKVQLRREIDMYYNEDSGGIHTAMEALDEIDNAPTVEAEPVRHGKWIGGELGECSVCGHHGCASDIWNGCANQYCPNCGAKMDEVKEE